MADSDLAGGNEVTALRQLVALALELTQQRDELSTMQLVAAGAESLAPCLTEGIMLDEVWQDAGRLGRSIQLGSLAEAAPSRHGCQVSSATSQWAWAYPIPAACVPAGYLVVGAARPLDSTSQFLLESLARHAGVAIASARREAREQAQAARLRAANLALQRSMEIHDRLTQVALRGEGQEGIARALYELTEHPAGIEDAFGNLLAWAGPGRPDPYPELARERRDRLLDRAMQAPGPVRDDDRLVSVARLSGNPVGVLVLADPDRNAGEAERVAIEHATTVLAMDLARLQSLGESRARARSSLALELVAGEDEAAIASRAQALGYDLGRPHRVVAVESRAQAGKDADGLFDAVRSAAAAHGVGSLLAPRLADIVLLADADAAWDLFQASVAARLNGGGCRVGIGGRCRAVQDFPRSYREAQLALRIQKAVGGSNRVTIFDDLGVYQVLATDTDSSAMDTFVRDWLGQLLDYDALHGSQLVTTLSEYFHRGGSYNATATALSVHRSTLKYRLRRIREVSGYDLGSPDIQFNLQLATRAWRTQQALRQT